MSGRLDAFEWRVPYEALGGVIEPPIDEAMFEAAPAMLKTVAATAPASAEAAVLAGLAAGHSVEEVATLRQSSVLTVRKQVASLLSKMECSRQAELVRLASLL